MSTITHEGFFNSREAPAPLHEFESELVAELGDIELDLLARHDEKAVAFLGAFTEMNVCDLLKDGKCDRILLEGARFVADRTKAGGADLDDVASSLSNRLNSRAWAVVKAPGQPSETYARALAQAEAAVLADPDANNVHTLATAQYRAGQLDAASRSIAQAIQKRTDHKPESLDSLVQALIDAKAGRTDAARVALKTIEDKRTAAKAAARQKGQQEPVNKEVDDFIDEVRAVLK